MRPPFVPEQVNRGLRETSRGESGSTHAADQNSTSQQLAADALRDSCAAGTDELGKFVEVCLKKRILAEM